MSEAALPQLPSWVPEFRPRPPWWGGHLQTLALHIRQVDPLHNRFDSEEYLLPLNDGTDDSLAAVLYRPQHHLFSTEMRPSPLIVLMHGLGGTSQSTYIQSSADFLLRQGHCVLLIDFRGAGDSAEHCDRLHHPGRTEDVARLLTGIDFETEAKLENSGVILVGYSLGGSVLLKFLGEEKFQAPGNSVHDAIDESDNRELTTRAGVLGAVAISAPLDLEATSRCLRRPSRWVYQKYLLRKMRRQALAEGADVTDAEREAVAAANSVWQFDETFTAARCGFDNVTDYYESFSAGRVLSNIKTPTLLIYAVDDPFVPAEQYHAIDWNSLPQLQPLIVPTGGHCGFLTAGLDGSWYDHCIDQFVRRLIGAADAGSETPAQTPD